MKNRILAAISLGAVLITGCNSTFITSSWKAPEVTSARNFKKVMVVGIIREADRTIRQKMEGHLVEDLKALGYQAVSAYDTYGPKTLQDMSEEKMKRKFSKEGVDAVLTIVLLDKQKERQYVPARVVYSPYITYHRHFYGYYQSLYTRIDAPGYYDVSTKYFWESNLYDLNENKLIYSVQTQTFDPSSTDKLAHEYGQKIIKNMLGNNILRKQELGLAKAL